MFRKKIINSLPQITSGTGSADLPLTTSARLVVVEENSNDLQYKTRPSYINLSLWY